VVGHLRRKEGTFSFRYDPGVAAALAAGFAPLPEFTALQGGEGACLSPYLFATFSQRIPHPQRPDFAVLMAAWGIEHPDDQFEILARSGGIQMTDRLELAEYRPADDDLGVPLDFRIAGFRHAGEPALAVGQPVEFRREPENRFDPSAVLVLDESGGRLGYVPRHYAELFARVLDSGATLKGEVVRQLVVPESKWLVRARRGS
jgi:hypothetical protein